MEYKDQNIFRIKQKFPQFFTENNKYVYKSCNRDCIIVLEKLPDTVTNENRKSIINPAYAKYRANKLKVIFIFNKLNLTILPHVHNIIDNLMFLARDEQIKYIKNENAESYEYDNNPENVISEGIHYYTSLEGAYYSEFMNNYSGPYVRYFSNGQLAYKINYINGERVGNITGWHMSTGKILYEGEYFNGYRFSKWRIYNKNGSKYCKIEYDGLGNEIKRSYY